MGLASSSTLAIGGLTVRWKEAEDSNPLVLILFCMLMKVQIIGFACNIT